MHDPLHLYLVFNPMINKNDVYQSQAHEFYHQLKNKALTNDLQDSFMYWGKLKVNESEESNFDDFKTIISLNKEQGEDTQLFITDYHNFWVAKVESVHKEIFNKDFTLPFYDDKNVEVWFKVTDMDLLSAEFEETSFYLNQLHVDNKFVKDKIEKVHPYIGGIKFPLVVQNKSLERYFGNVFAEDGLRVRRNNALIENPKMSDEISFQVKSFVLPPHVFSKLSNIVKSEILGVETVLARREKDNPKLFENVLSSYLRILESIMSDSFGNILKREYGDCLFVSNDGTRFFDHKNDNNLCIKDFKATFSMKAFVDFLSNANNFGNLSLLKLKNNYPGLINYFITELNPLIEEKELIHKRFILQEGKQLFVDKKQAIAVRNEILGVGCKGVINNLINLTWFNHEEETFKDIA